MGRVVSTRSAKPKLGPTRVKDAPSSGKRLSIAQIAAVFVAAFMSMAGLIFLHAHQTNHDTGHHGKFNPHWSLTSALENVTKQLSAVHVPNLHVNLSALRIMDNSMHSKDHKFFNEFLKGDIDMSTGMYLRKNTRKRIAYAITMSKDGSFLDCAAVLAYSIHKISQNVNYDVSLIAFVHPNVTSSRPILHNLGYHVIEAMTPINSSAINPKFDFLKEKIEKNGCCGSSELIKLHSYR
jgi:hypothetical protein